MTHFQTHNDDRKSASVKSKSLVRKGLLKKMKATPPLFELVLYYSCIYVTGVNVYDFFLFKLVDKISLNLIKVLLTKYLQMFNTTLKFVMTNKSSLKRTNRCKMLINIYSYSFVKFEWKGTGSENCVQVVCTVVRTCSVYSSLYSSAYR